MRGEGYTVSLWGMGAHDYSLEWERAMQVRLGFESPLWWLTLFESVLTASVQLLVSRILLQEVEAGLLQNALLFVLSIGAVGLPTAACSTSCVWGGKGQEEA